MEELVKTGDYAALVAHCEDTELKVSCICLCIIMRYGLSIKVDVCVYIKYFVGA